MWTILVLLVIAIIAMVAIPRFRRAKLLKRVLLAIWGVRYY